MEDGGRRAVIFLVCLAIVVAALLAAELAYFAVLLWT